MKNIFLTCFERHFLTNFYVHILPKHLHVFCRLLKPQVSALDCGESGRKRCGRIGANHEEQEKTRESPPKAGFAAAIF